MSLASVGLSLQGGQLYVSSSNGPQQVFTAASIPDVVSGSVYPLFSLPTGSVSVNAGSTTTGAGTLLTIPTDGVSNFCSLQGSFTGIWTCASGTKPTLTYYLSQNEGVPAGGGGPEVLGFSLQHTATPIQTGTSGASDNLGTVTLNIAACSATGTPLGNLYLNVFNSTGTQGMTLSSLSWVAQSGYILQRAVTNNA
jgi:hypothetical protein